MIPYDLIQTDAGLHALTRRLRPVRRLAVDLEGENNLHAYGIRVCLLQLFDGERGYLVDPLAIENKDLLKELFEGAGWLAVMFDSANDLLALQHDLGTRPRSLCDLAVAASLLGLRGGLHAHLGAAGALGAAPTQPLSARAKDRFQKSNWLRRPFSKAMLDYAISDVTGLLDLADTMIAELEHKGLRDEFEMRNRAALDKERTWNPLSNFPRIPGFGRMNRENRTRAKVLWYAREYYARGHDLPPEAVASKPQLTAIVERGLATAEQIAAFLNEGRKRYPVDPRQLSPVLAAAERDAAADPRRG
jgi:ribonuclease D